MDRIEQVEALQALGLDPLISQSENDYTVSVVLNEKIFCLAFDSKDGLATLASLEEKHGKIPETWCQITPDGGLQYYFKSYVRSKHCKGIGVDIFGKGATVVISDADYAWHLNKAPDQCALASRPGWLDGFIISHHFVDAPFVLSAVPKLPTNVSALIPEKVKQEPRAFPDPMGIWGRLRDVCLERAPNKIPEFALAASSAIMSAVLQRTVVPHRGGNVNAYIYAFAPQSGGKGYYQQFVEDVLTRVNEKLIFPKTASASALQEMLSEYPSGIAVMDEATKAFKSVFGNAKQQDALSEQKHSLLLTLWSPVQRLAAVKVRAKGMSIPGVKFPRYSEFGVGIMSEFEQVLSNDEAQKGGFLSRIEPYVSTKKYFSRMKPREEMVSMGPIPQTLIDQLIALQGPLKFVSETAGDVPVLHSLPMHFDPDAFQYFQTVEDELEAMSHRASQSWEEGWYGRAAEKIERDATKHAAGRLLTYVTISDVQFAVEKYKAHEETFFKMMNEAPCSDFERCRRDVLRVLANHSPLTKSALRAKSYLFKKMSPKLQKELLDDLAETQEIAITDRKNGCIICLVKRA